MTCREWNMEDTIKYTVDEDPGESRQKNAEPPPFSGTEFELKKGAKGDTHREAEQPDGGKVAEDPAKDPQGPMIHQIHG